MFHIDFKYFVLTVSFFFFFDYRYKQEIKLIGKFVECFNAIK